MENENLVEAESYINRGEAKYNSEDLEGALADFTKAIALNPNDAKAFNNRGGVKCNSGNFEGALADFTKAISLNPKYSNPFFNRGLANTKLKNYKEALEDFTQAIALNSNDSEAFNKRGFVKDELKKYKEAIEDYTQVIALKPNEPETFRNRGLAKAALKKYNEAIDDYNQAIALNPKYSKAFNDRGIAKDELKNFNGAIEDYNQAIALNPNNSKAFYNKGNANRTLKKYNEAIEDYNQAIALNPKLSEAFINRGTAKATLKNYIEAIGDFNQAIALNQNLSAAFYNRGIANTELENHKEAREDYYSSFEKSIKDDKRMEEFKTIKKFRTIDRYTLDIIKKNKIWFAHPKTFNDPLDGNFLQRYFHKSKELIKVLNTILVYSSGNDTKENSLDFDNLMWAHYSQNHSGICLVYEFINNENEENEFYIDKINYKPEIKNPDLTDVNTIMQDGFFTKDEIWKHEKELRILYLLKEGEQEKYKDGKAIPLKDLGLQLKEIIFGLKCTEKNRIKIYKLLQLLQRKKGFPEVIFSEMKEELGGNFFKLKKEKYIFTAKRKNSLWLKIKSLFLRPARNL